MPMILLPIICLNLVNYNSLDDYTFTYTPPADFADRTLSPTLADPYGEATRVVEISALVNDPPEAEDDGRFYTNLEGSNRLQFTVPQTIILSGCPGGGKLHSLSYADRLFSGLSIWVMAVQL